MNTTVAKLVLYTRPFPQTILSRLIVEPINWKHEGTSALIMKEAIVRKDTSVDIVDSPIPKPGPGHVLIKVIVAGRY